MKIYINRGVVRGPWGGGAHFINNALRVFHDSKAHEIVYASNHNDPFDAALVLGLDADKDGVSLAQLITYKIMMSTQKDVKLVLRLNENDARKNTHHLDDKLVSISSELDGTIFVSDWLKSYFKTRGWKCKKNVVIKNGVDSIFKPPAQKLESDQIRIVTHHWSDNYHKGFDIYDKLDEFVRLNPEFKFTYIGRERGTFRYSTVVKPLHGEALATALGQNDVYVSGSRFDPGPNHVLEALACGLPTYVHADGGGAVEFAGKDHTFKTWEELEQILLSKKYVLNKTASKLTDWDQPMAETLKFIESL